MTPSNFETFYESSFSRIFAAVYVACGSREVAQDATQEAFKRAFTRWSRLRGKPWVAGWVMTTALNVCKRDVRRAEREPAFTDRSTVAPSDSMTAEHLDLWFGLRKLPFRQREAVILHYLEDLPLPAVAQLMDVAEGTVKAHLAQARKILRSLLEVEDVR